MTTAPDRCLLAVALTDTRIPLAEQAARARAGGADVLELRLDLLDPNVVAAALPALRLPLILTVRESSEGGGFSGTVTEKLARLDRFLPHARWVDLELAVCESSGEVRGWLQQLRKQADRPGVIVSWHNFTAPDDARPDRDDQSRRELAAVGARMAAISADVEKLVCTATDMVEVLAMLSATADSGRSRICLAMGDAGLPSRVLTAGQGGWLTFATLPGESGSAPGQPALDVLKGRYRMDSLTAQTPVLGVLGWPVSHSLSPVIHNEAMAVDGRAGVYLPFAISPEGDALDRVLRRLLRDRALPVHGCSVTLPHKEKVLRWLEAHGEQVSPGAAACGAVNTLVRVPGGWLGENSDVTGVRAALDEVGWRADGSVTVLGAGGVARAVLAALGADAARATVYNRTRSRSESLAADFGCAVGAWESRDAASGSLLVNCTSIGMAPDDSDVPLLPESVGQYGTVFDTIYTPAVTQLLRVAESSGCRVASGLTMFVAQAEQQYRWWFGAAPPAGCYRTALDRHLLPGDENS